MSQAANSSPARPVALVTGPTAGLGRRFAVRLAERGHDLVLVARDRGRLEELAVELERDHGASSEVLVADLADREQLKAVERRAAATERPVELVVNNAGFGMKHPFLDNDVEDEQRMLEVLVTAVMRLSHAALGQMVERGSGGIINVSSVAGELPRGTYSAAKAYVTQLSKWSDATYRDQGVRTMALLPGFTRTEFHSRMDVKQHSAPAWMWLDADRVVRDGLRDFDAGRSVSVPSKRYKLITTAVRAVPYGVQAKFQSLGRK
ncbi:SDR family NAD(P)-dependent oxidoreductase [Nocardioides caldifontis]|uniref:SDR family NAD(P)-dependent oxidoreductase n=1 Tax=Nocardioides caldifontis TaxID=2588938 RepID=UPI0011DF50A6|nr:SDR family NAD(P)-dependent oxidoreductase [Nocardioides caldifontis]